MTPRYHRLYLASYDGWVMPRLLRKLIARSGFHRARSLSRHRTRNSGRPAPAKDAVTRAGSSARVPAQSLAARGIEHDYAATVHAV